MSFPRYPKYKDSGVEWLGEVPEHWDVRRLRQIGPLLKGCGGSKEDVVETGVPCVRYGDLYTTHAYMIRQARTCVTEERAADYFPIRLGDVLFAASGEDLAEIGRSAVVLVDERACCGGDLVVLRPDVGVVPEFMGYACDCSVAKSQKASMGRGTTVKHIYPDELKRLLLAVPPLPEQAHIATFLDRETAKIDALIAEQQRLIELLQEKRQAVISHAVTKGLNPDAKMKDSGIEWLGEVPEHWQCASLIRIAERVVVGIAEAATHAYVDDGTPILRSTNIKGGTIAGEVLLIDPAFAAERGSKAIRAGDLVTVRTGNAGATAVVPPELADCQCFTMLVTTLKEGFCPDFYGFWINSVAAQTYFQLEGWGTAQINISVPILKALPVPMPPKSEQHDIVDYLRGAIAESDALSEAAKSAITLLQERRSALISAAVTGQIDVRGLAGSEAA
jgi:type I restriction enzyme, S subunit